MQSIYSLLDELNISYQDFQHPAVFTCDDAAQYCPEMPGVAIKNLFLKDKKNDTFFLIVVPDHKRVDLKALKNELGLSSLSFASEDDLVRCLAVQPGSVTILGLMNDHDGLVSPIFDQSLEDKSLQCHPLINTATLVIAPEGLAKFLEHTGHKTTFLQIPQR